MSEGAAMRLRMGISHLDEAMRHLVEAKKLTMSNEWNEVLDPAGSLLESAKHHISIEAMEEANEGNQREEANDDETSDPEGKSTR